ncbi:twin-arginine translocase subunit TatC [Lujinxingia litoralis]|uniref:Sec-independent protein translocase protein TatC n=1 Tax=Lujinxingia litoralis TaxID=2211119 RepID=A0A328C858_9DELT|nr:twin-arginine translocase subunit TatC [Lujinxingia litoralis]RAL20768.1 twin-arginine translocase subunit TatC [Lujinxingia litoralis]
MSDDASPDPRSQASVESLHDMRMSFMGHLAELRRRFLFSFVALVIAFLVCWNFATDIFNFLLQPLINAAPEGELANMHNADLAEPFFTLLKTAILAAVFLASPAILFNIWRFVAPGLYPNEKRAALPFVFFGTLFFFLGASFCYFVVIPFGYAFLLGFSLEVSNPTLMIKDYFALTTKLLLGFGMVFELPVVTSFLSAVGLLTHRHLLKHWRIAVIAAFILAAILTPPDVVTQMMLAAPLILLYGLSILVAWFITTRRERRAARELKELS